MGSWNWTHASFDDVNLQLQDGLVLVVKSVSGTGDMVIHFENGMKLTIELEGDCCSHSYFSDDSFREARGLIGERLVSIEETDNLNPKFEHEAGNPDECDVIRWSGIKIRTDKQETVLDWRNDSNGYYSGWICGVTLE